MSCREIEQMLPEYAADRLNLEEKEQVDAHLKICGSCRDELSEIIKINEIAGHEESILDAPPEFFETVWNNLYSRIQKEGLNKQRETVFGRLSDFMRSFRPGVFQIVNVVLIIAAGTWFFVSYRADSVKPSLSTVQTLIDQNTVQLRNEMGEKVVKGKEVLKDALSMGLTASGESVEKLKNLMNPEKQGQLYNSVTDYLADVMIKISKKS